MATGTDPSPSAGVLDAVLEVSRELDLARLLQRVVELARELVGARYAALGVISDDGTELADFLHSGLTPEQVAEIGHLPRGAGVLGELIRHPHPLRLADLAHHPASVGFPLHHPPMSSFLGVPIEGHEGVLGNLYLTEKLDGGSFSDTDEAIVTTLAAQAAVSIENARLYAQQAQTAKNMEALFRAVGALNQTVDSIAVLQVIVDVARELVDASYAALAVLGAEGDQSAFIHSGIDPATAEQIGHLPVGRGLLGTVTVEGRPLRLRSIAEHPSSVGFPAHHPPMDSFLGVPVRGRDGTVLGNIYMTDKRSAVEFSVEDEQLATALAAQASVAIENSRSYERERDMVERMQSLVAANLALTKELRPDAVLQMLVDVARRVGGAEYAALGVLDESGDALSAFLHSGMDPDLVDRIGPLPKGLGVLKAVIVARRPIRLTDLMEHPASVGFPAHHPAMHAFLGVPLEYQGRVFGNLYLTNKIGGGDFTDEDEQVVSALAAQAAVAIQNARVYEREQELVDELRSLNGAKSDFVSTVSHELRSPITALSGLSQMLQRHRDEMSDDEVTESLAAIDRQAVRLNRLVGQLLDLSRIESAQFAVVNRSVELRPVVEHAVDGLVADDAPPVEVVVPPGLRAHVDPDRLDQILVNLVTNAARHGGPHIEVTAVELDDAVELCVADDGTGVPESLQSRLFERFARGKNPGGSGLGLAISAALAEAMGGTLEYRARPGQGARFVLRLLKEPQR